jgi:hypothetical protein
MEKLGQTQLGDDGQIHQIECLEPEQQTKQCQSLPPSLLDYILVSNGLMREECHPLAEVVEIGINAFRQWQTFGWPDVRREGNGKELPR